MLFTDRLLLSRHSLHALEVCTAVQALVILFQLPCIRIASISQVFVGQYLGSSRISLIGPAIWQMIWFSFLSMLIVVPLGYGLQPFFFSASRFPEGKDYFQLLLWMNFLFPLNSALSCFYLGLGRNRMIILSQITTHVIRIILDYLLIFGIEGIIPSMGFKGAAWAAIIAQAAQSAILFTGFLKKEFHQLYHTYDFRLKKKLFLEGIQIGLPKAIARFCLLAVWTCNVRIMMGKGESYLVIVAFGSTLVGTLTFITEGMSQGLVTIASMLIGAKKWPEISRLYRSSFLFSIGTITLLSLPLLFFSDYTIGLFFKTSYPVPIPLLHKTCVWIWILLISNAVNFIGVSFLTAYKDTMFHMLANLISWVICYLPILIGIGIWNWPADSFWVVLALEPLIIASLHHLRLRKEKGRVLDSVKSLELG